MYIHFILVLPLQNSPYRFQDIFSHSPLPNFLCVLTSIYYFVCSIIYIIADFPKFSNILEIKGWGRGDARSARKIKHVHIITFRRRRRRHRRRRRTQKSAADDPKILTCCISNPQNNC